MNIFSGLESIVETDYRLAPHTWYGIGGPAEFFICPETIEQLSEVVKRCTENELPVRVLGFGSNLLVSDQGVKGAVIKFDAPPFKQSEFGEDGELTAWAGADLGALVLDCVKRGYGGLETLSGIPGSVGGAIRMNAGGNFGDLGSVVEEVTLMDNQGGVFTKVKPELVFDYRSTNITARFILNAKIKLVPSDPDQIMRTVQEIWIHKKNNQPLNTRNCGCIFKNPPGQSAGAMIDRAGLKGLAVGGARVSDKHANFILADTDCQSADVERLVEVIRERIREQFNVELETEIEIWK